MTFADIRHLPTLPPSFLTGSRIAACVGRFFAARAAHRAEMALIGQLRKLDSHQLGDIGIDATALQSIVPRICRIERIE